MKTQMALNTAKKGPTITRWGQWQGSAFLTCSQAK